MPPCRWRGPLLLSQCRTTVAASGTNAADGFRLAVLKDSDVNMRYEVADSIIDKNFLHQTLW